MSNNNKKYVSLSKLQKFLENLSNKFAALTHKHTTADITDYKVDASLSSTSTNPVQNKVINDELDAIANAMNALDLAIDGKADSSHEHDGRYYTETEVDTKLSGKANSSHSHAISEVTNLQTSLNAKVPTSRTVNGKALTENITLSASDVGAAASSHDHNDKYYTESEIDTKLASKSDTTHKHDSLYDTKGAAAAVQTNLDAVSDTINEHIDDVDVHVTTANKTNWNTAYTHSQATHARIDATKVEDSTTNGNIKINGTETNVYSHPNSGVTAGTYKSVTVNAQGHVTGGSNPTTLAGYGITDGETKGAANTALASAKEYTDTIASGKSDKTHNHDSKYDAIGAAADSLASAKSYTDTKVSGLASTSAVNTKISTHNTATTAHNDIRDLISGLTNRLNTLADSDDTTLDQLSEIVTYIKNNKSLIDGITTSKVNVADIINNLTTNVANKPLSAAQGVAIKGLIDSLQEELDSHTHAIADVSGLQSALDGKAASSHGTHVTYSTTAPVMDGTASVGSASTVARSDHKHPTDTSRASKTEFDTHVSDTTKHITSTERTNWGTAYTHSQAAHAPSNAEKNQNAFSNITVGSTTVTADTATDTVTFVGSNVTITPDATNDKITFAVADGSTSTKGIVQLTNSTSSTSTTTAATPNSVKTAYDLANTAKTNAATAQTRADSAYTLAESKVDSLSDLGITATATELNYIDGVTSSVQTQLNGKAASTHNHSASNIISGTLAIERGGTGNIWGYVQAGALEDSSIGALATAEGRKTTASGSYSHAEGNYTEATGNSAHAEGQNSTASGTAAHAEGENTTASGSYSHAEGENTLASSNHQHVQGKFNKEDTTGTYAHIVGNGTGTSSSKRSNAHTVDWSGNGWFAGDVYVGGTSQSEGSKLLTCDDISWSLIYDSGEISAIANSIAGINVSGYTKFRIVVRCYNDGDSYGDRSGSAIFKAQNGKSYQFPVWTNMFSKSISTVSAMADFELTDDWLVCPHASRLTGEIDIFTETEGGTASNLTYTGSSIMKCTSPLSTLTISNLDQNSRYYFGIYSRVMVWGCK